MIQTVIRTAFFYLVLILCMRLLGKRQVGELQPSELVVTILISDLASIPMQDLNRPVTNGIIAISVMVILELLLSALSLKIPFFRRIFSGKPAIVIADGKIDQSMMRKLRYSIDDLLEGLRADGCFSLDDVNYAILETSGTLSVMKKKADEPPTRSEMNVKISEAKLPITLISDGKLQHKAVKAHGISMNKINSELKKNKLTVKEVFLMTYNESGDFITLKKEL